MRALAGALARWNALSKALRMALAAGALAVLVLSALAAMLAHPPTLALFPAPLHPEQLAEVEERLAGWNVPFTPAADNVIVAAGRRNDLLLRLSLAGVPHPHLSSSGEALANVGVLAPQAVVDAQTLAGLAGDIEAGLRGIAGVDDARVIVAAGKPPEFAGEAPRAASASVRLRLLPGAALSGDTVAGIQSFVAASVPQLDPAHVAVLDDRGVSLGDALARDDGADLQRSLQTALDAAFGEAATIVRVHSEHIAQPQPATGTLDRVSTALFVDANRSIDVEKVRALAAAAVGYDPGRGDSLRVEAVPFPRKMPAHGSRWWALYGAFAAFVPPIAYAAALVLCVRLALPPIALLAQSLAARAQFERTASAAEGLPPARLRTLLAREPPHAAAAIISALPAATATAVLDLYPPHEREAIVRRMQRPHSPLVDDASAVLGRHA